MEAPQFMSINIFLFFKILKIAIIIAHKNHKLKPHCRS